MNIFKLFFQIIYKYKISVFLTVAIVFGYSLILVSNGNEQYDISGANANVVIFDEDNTTASKGLIDYLNSNTKVVEMDKEKIENAVFYGEIDYVLYIPKGYEESIIANKSITVENKSSPKSNSKLIIDNYVELYGNTLRSYYAYETSDIELSVDSTIDDLSVEVNYETLSKKDKVNVSGYFNFLFYSFITTLITAIGLVLLQLNKIDIRRRINVSPISNISLNSQLLFATVCFGLLLVGIFTAFAYGYYGSAMSQVGSYLYIVNMLVLLFTASSIAYFIAILVKKSEALSGISNVLGLGLSFIGGVFVPLELLGSNVIAVAKFTPSYWYVSTNEKIYLLNNLDNLGPIYNNIIILAGFGVLFLVFALIITKLNTNVIKSTK